MFYLEKERNGIISISIFKTKFTRIQLTFRIMNDLHIIPAVSLQSSVKYRIVYWIGSCDCLELCPLIFMPESYHMTQQSLST